MTRSTARSTDHPSIVDQISSECLLGHWRKVNRVLSGIYEGEMRAWGLKSSQLNLRVAVAKAGPVRRIDLGARLKITPKGRKLLDSIAPAWKRAQARARQMLGSEGAALVLGLKECV